MAYLSDEEVLKRMATSMAPETGRLLRQLYEQHFRKIASMVRKSYGSEEEAADVFQDSLMAFYQKCRGEVLQLDCQVGTYIYAIARNLWHKRLREKNRSQIVALEDPPESVDDADSALELLEHSEKSQAIAKLLNQIGDDCRKIILLFYYEKLSIKKIRERMQLVSDQVVKNRKSRCLKKMKEEMQNNPSLLNLLR